MWSGRWGTLQGRASFVRAIGRSRVRHNSLDDGFGGLVSIYMTQNSTFPENRFRHCMAYAITMHTAQLNFHRLPQFCD